MDNGFQAFPKMPRLSREIIVTEKDEEPKSFSKKKVD